jgi:hypothetical protein
VALAVGTVPFREDSRGKLVSPAAAMGPTALHWHQMCGCNVPRDEMHRDRMHTQETYTIQKCTDSNDYVSIQYLKLVSLTPCGECNGNKACRKGQLKPICHGWIAALDPESYGIRDDLDSFGIEWCNTDTCLNHHRFHAENLTSRLASKGQMERRGCRLLKSIRESWGTFSLMKKVEY